MHKSPPPPHHRQSPLRLRHRKNSQSSPPPTAPLHHRSPPEMGGVLGKRPRVAAAPDADDAGGVPDHRDAAGLDEKGLSGRAVARVEIEARGDLADAAGLKDKGLAEESGRAVAHVDVQPIDARAQGNGNCPRTAADLTHVEGRGRDVFSVKLVDVGATGGAASSGQQQKQEEEKEVEHGTFPQLQKSIGQQQQEKEEVVEQGIFPIYQLQGITDISSQDVEGQHIGNEGIPMTWKKEAMVLDKLILRKIRPLRQAVSAGNFRRSKVTFFGQRIEGKVANLEADLSDRKYFHESVSLFGKLTESERCTSAVLSELSPPPPVDLALSLEMKRKQARGRGIEPVKCGDCFGVPKSGLTGNVPLDEMNWMLADTYCSISFLLERLQMVTILLKFDKDFLEDGERELLDLKAAVEVLRTSGCKLRKEVVELGYAPLIEPIAIWKQRFYAAKF